MANNLGRLIATAYIQKWLNFFNGWNRNIRLCYAICPSSCNTRRRWVKNK